MKRNEIGLVHDATNLRKLISEHPDLPIVVLAGEEANGGDYCWMYCSSISCCIDYILDTKTPYDSEYVFTDRDEFEDKVADALYDDYCEKSDDEYAAAIKAEIVKYEPYWKKVIAIYATN
jgi:hypothetical protein